MNIRKLILGYPYVKTRRMIRDSEFLDRLTLQNLQNKYLAQLLIYASRNIPYYRNITNGKIPDNDAISFLKIFPIINKDIIRNNLFLFVKHRDFRIMKATSGGSTGQPFVFYMDRFVTRQREKAFIFDQWSRVGYHLGDKIFNIRGRTPGKGQFIKHDRLLNIYFVSSFDLSKEHTGNYINAINEIRPDFLQGYPSTMYQLALLIEHSGKKPNVRFKGVFCGSEKLFNFQRSKIEAVFDCKTYHWYGHSECLVLGGECEHSHAFHLYPQYGYTELLPTGMTNAEGKEIYEIVATGFNNRIMPLIRYRTGDYAILANSQDCQCGRQYPLIEEIIGREQEFVIDKNETVISATSLIFGQHYSVFEGLDSIKLSQDKPGVVEFLLVKNSRFNDTSFEQMKHKIHDLLQDRVEISFSFQQSIEKTAIGKSKLVDQKLDIAKYLHSRPGH